MILNIFKREDDINIFDNFQQKNIVITYYKKELNQNKIIELLKEYKLKGGMFLIGFPYWLRELGYNIDIN